MDDTSKEKKFLSIVYGDVTLGIHGKADGKEFHYIFSYGAGGMESLVVNNKEWLYRIPKPTFWRASTDNDRGNHFPVKSGMWFGADMFIACVGIEVTVDNRQITLPCAPENNQYSSQETANNIAILYTYETITKPKTMVAVQYHIDASGEIQINVHYYGKEGLPQMPVFGLRFIMPTCADGFSYKGLSGETYPDRKAGGIAGVYHIEGMPVTPYLVPQDCGMHINTKWVKIYRTKVLDNRIKEHKRTALCFMAEEGGDFAFSCLPYTAAELESAFHQDELPPARRTVLCIYGAVRGVGGIDSWGADVESDYQINAAKDIQYSFRIKAV